MANYGLKLQCGSNNLYKCTSTQQSSTQTNNQYNHQYNNIVISPICYQDALDDTVVAN